MAVVIRRQLRYLGHILSGDSVDRDCLLRMIKGRRAQGRQRVRYMDEMKEMKGREKI